MVEALAGCLKWANDSLLENMRQYQGLMGDIQDADVLLRAFEKFFRKEKMDAKPAAKLTHELLKRREQLIAKYLSAADGVMNFWPPVKTLNGAKRRGVSPIRGNRDQVRSLQA